MNWYKISKKINMKFPKDECGDLKSRLKRNKNIFTTRVDREQNKYRVGDIVKVDFWDNELEVVSVKTYSDIRKHPFYRELTDDWKNQIKDKKFDVIELEELDELV